MPHLKYSGVFLSNGVLDMSRGNVGLWKATYREAIEYIYSQQQLELPAIKINKRTTLKQYRDIWKQVRKAHREAGIDLPSVRVVSKEALERKAHEFDYETTPRDDYMNTLPPEQSIDKGYEYIENFKKQLEVIYQNTKTQGEGWKDKSLSSEERRSRYIIYANIDLIDATYTSILTALDMLVLQFGYDEVADALASDVELDYTIALTFMPPSSVLNEMELTLEQIQGIMTKLTAKYENI